MKIRRGRFTYQKGRSSKSGEIEAGNDRKTEKEKSVSYFPFFKENKELCPSACLIRRTGWTDYHGRNTLSRERRESQGGE